MKKKNIRVLALAMLAALVLGLVILFVCCGGIVFRIEPMFIKTIDKPDSGTGEVIVETIVISGVWMEDVFDENRAFFDGTLLPIGLMDYGHLPGGVKDVNICFSRGEGHWVGKIDYLSTDLEWKTMQVYTDAEHSVWVFTFEDRVVYAPAEIAKDVRSICESLNIELK